MTVFDELALAYDNTIDWKSRLEREMPFILSSVSQKSGLKVLDIACGSGRHAIELAKQGFDVFAFDSSQAMLETAMKLAERQNVRIDFQLLDMHDIKKTIKQEFHLITCLGNSLALLDSIDDFNRMIESVHSLLTAEGIFIFQTLNFEAVEEQGIRFMPSKTGTLKTGEDVTFSRFLDYTQGDTEKATLVLSAILDREGSKPVVQTQEVLRITGPRVETALKVAGFRQYSLYSDYAGSDFQPQFDRNIVTRTIK